jgi:hypothetical protein
MDGIVRARAAWTACRDGGNIAEHLSSADLPGVLHRLGSIAALPPRQRATPVSASKAAQADHAERRLSIRMAARCAYGAGIGGIVVSLPAAATGRRTTAALPGFVARHGYRCRNIVGVERPARSHRWAGVQGVVLSHLDPATARTSQGRAAHADAVATRGMSFCRLIEGGAEIAGRCRPGCREWRST